MRGVLIPEAFGFKAIYNRLTMTDQQIAEDIMRREGIETRFNLRSFLVEIRVGDGAWTRYRPFLKDRIRLVVTDYGFVNNNQKRYPRAIGVTSKIATHILGGRKLCLKEEDPFKTWLQNLPAWDGVPRIDTFFSDLWEEHEYAPAESLISEYGKWASRYVFIAAVQKTFFMESESDRDLIPNRPLLIGRAGIGKRDVLKALLPKREKWVEDNYILQGSYATSFHPLRDCVIYLNTVIPGMKPGEYKRWHKFAGARTIKVRSKHILFRGVGIPLIDGFKELNVLPPEEQKDFVILLGYPKSRDEFWIRERREQLWAEAMRQVQDGVRARLPEGLRDEAVAHSVRVRRMVDPVEYALDVLPAEFPPTKLVDLLIMCGVVSDYQEGMQNFGVVTHFMRQLVAHGCERIPLSDTYTNRLFGYWKREIK